MGIFREYNGNKYGNGWRKVRAFVKQSNRTSGLNVLPWDGMSYSMSAPSGIFMRFEREAPGTQQRFLKELFGKGIMCQIWLPQLEQPLIRAA